MNWVIVIVFLFMIFGSESKRIVWIEVDHAEGSSIVLAPAWNVTVASDVLSTDIGECPAGSYCPSASVYPIPCPLGTYSDKKTTWSPCSSPCPSNWYCPDAATKKMCPEHTWSKEGSVSIVDCMCDGGYICTYKKQTNVNVILHLPFEMWQGNSTIQELLRLAVANAAGVSVGNVVIDYALPHLGGSGGNRRSLQSMTRLLNIQCIVTGGDGKLTDLDKHLDRVGHAVGSPIVVRSYYQNMDRVHIRKKSFFGLI